MARGVWEHLGYNKRIAASTTPFSPGNGRSGLPLRSPPKDGFVLIEKQHRGGGAFDELAARLDLQFC